MDVLGTASDSPAGESCPKLEQSLVRSDLLPLVNMVNVPVSKIELKPSNTAKISFTLTAR